MLNANKLLIFLLTICGAAIAQSSGTVSSLPKPAGVKEVQVPFSSLKPSATFKIGGTADWVLVTDDSVWITGSKPYSVQRIDPATNKVVAKVRLPGQACSGLASGFGTIWVPLCGKKPSLARMQESQPVATAFGSSAIPRAHSVESIRPRIQCGRRFQFHRAPITHFSARAQSGSRDSRATSWSQLMLRRAECLPRFLSDRSHGF